MYIWVKQIGMEKSEILDGIENSLVSKKNAGRNSMGVSESFYNPYFLVGMCFTDNKSISLDETALVNMDEYELNNLIKLAEFAGDAFY